MGGMFGRFRGRRSLEVYQRPHNYSFVIGIFGAGVPATCVSLNRQRLPVTMFLVQADLANGGIVNIGDETTSLINGIQLDPGRAMQFSIGRDEMQGSLYPTPMDWTEAVRTAQGNIPKAPEPDLLLDVSNFYVAGDAANQRVRVFWTMLAS
jgi:hypothetical protein